MYVRLLLFWSKIFTLKNRLKSSSSRKRLLLLIPLILYHPSQAAMAAFAVDSVYTRTRPKIRNKQTNKRREFIHAVSLEGSWFWFL